MTTPSKESFRGVPLTPPPGSRRAPLDAPEGDQFVTVGQLTNASNALKVVTPSGAAGFVQPKLVASLVVDDYHASANDQRHPLMEIIVEVPRGTASGGFAPGTRFTVTSPNYQTFKNAVNEYGTGVRTNLNRLIARPETSDPVLNNDALPTPVKMRDSLGSLLENPSPMCRRYASDMKTFITNYLTQDGVPIADRNDLSIFQGPKSGRSPGFLVHQPTGQLYMFDSTGKGYVTIDRGTTTIKGSAFNTGPLDHEKTHSVIGMPVVANKVLEMVPNGTIVTPQPAVLPNFTKIAALILTICDMIDLMSTCVLAVRTIMNMEDESTVMEEANRSSFEDSWQTPADRREWGEGEHLGSLSYQDPDLTEMVEEEDPNESLEEKVKAEEAVLSGLQARRDSIQRDLTEMELRRIGPVTSVSKEEQYLRDQLSFTNGEIAQSQTRLNSYLEEYMGE